VASVGGRSARVVAEYARNRNAARSADFAHYILCFLGKFIEPLVAMLDVVLYISC